MKEGKLKDIIAETPGGKIFLACPYSGTEQERKSRFALATRFAGELISLGKLVFSPITHGHAIASYTPMPLTYKFWRYINNSFIEWCDELYVLCIPGWEQSEGVTAEIAYAKELGKRVIFNEVRDGGVELAHKIGQIGDAPII